ncbi:hypothetical protein Hdeb2414_s0792g00947561 [Helianthus debilis subsp. tardiflorus]
MIIIKVCGLHLQICVEEEVGQISAVYKKSVFLTREMICRSLQRRGRPNLCSL